MLTSPNVNAAQPLSPAEAIERLARDRIEVFEASIRPDGTYKDPIYRSARSASVQIAADYGRRFLLELIQNAHDAHLLDETAGEIKVVLDSSADGTLLRVSASARWLSPCEHTATPR